MDVRTASSSPRARAAQSPGDQKNGVLVSTRQMFVTRRMSSCEHRRSLSFVRLLRIKRTRSQKMDGAIPANVTSLSGGRVVVERRSSENHGVHGVQKIDGAIPANVTSLSGGRVVVERRAAKITEYTEYRKRWRCGATHNPLEADAQPPRGGRTPPQRRTHSPPEADAQPP